MEKLTTKNDNWRKYDIVTDFTDDDVRQLLLLVDPYVNERKVEFDDNDVEVTKMAFLRDGFPIMELDFDDLAGVLIVNDEIIAHPEIPGITFARWED